MALKRPSALAALGELLEQAEGIPIELNQLKALRMRHERGEKWSATVAALLAPQAHPSADAMRAALTELRLLGLAKVTDVMEPLALLQARLLWIDEWMSRVAIAFVKPGCSRPLRHVLTDEEPDKAWPPSDHENQHSCACCTPSEAPSEEDRDVSWVGCDNCDGWFHPVCVAVSEHEAAGIDEYLCPRCCSQRSVPYRPAGPGTPARPLPALKRTCRPPFREAVQLMTEADAQPVRIPEMDALRKLLLETEAWRLRLQDAPPGEARDELLRVASRLEVQPPEVLELQMLQAAQAQQQVQLQQMPHDLPPQWQWP